MGVAAYFGLKQKDVVQLLAEVERTVATWRQRGRELGMNPAELDQFADAFEHGEREVAQSVVRAKAGLVSAVRAESPATGFADNAVNLFGNSSVAILGRESRNDQHSTAFGAPRFFAFSSPMFLRGASGAAGETSERSRKQHAARWSARF
jgi:hypothetical protein